MLQNPAYWQTCQSRVVNTARVVHVCADSVIIVLRGSYVISNVQMNFSTGLKNKVIGVYGYIIVAEFAKTFASDDKYH